MKAVIDEGVPRRLARALTAAGLETDAFRKAWSRLDNGKLLDQVAAAGYGVLITNDKNMAFQQNLKGRTIAVVALPANRWASLAGRIDDIADTIRRAKPGHHTLMDVSGRRWTRGHDDRAPMIEELPPIRSFAD